jgi:TRAP-type mannitol/chloroaromatic compound transport system substrate-binding protein
MFLRASTGVQMGGWFNREINALDDYKGLKFRMPGLGGEVLRRLGAAVINLPVGEIFPALQSGAIDGTEWGRGTTWPLASTRWRSFTIGRVGTSPAPRAR